MCGIIAAVANRNVTPILINGLHQMEYRGYDSAGISLLDTVNNDCIIKTAKVKGRVKVLEEKIKEKNTDDQYYFKASLGIAHTRWATHGEPSEKNAHPLLSDNQFAVVHNGIIENYVELKSKLVEEGYQFVSGTDTEVIAHLLNSIYQQNPNSDIKDVVQKTVKKLTGSYAIAVLTTHAPDRIYAARSGSPLIIGLGIEENFIASDQLALIPVTNKFIFLEENDLVVLSTESVAIYNTENSEPIQVEREIHQYDQSLSSSVELGNYRHYMQKEIAEQPSVIAELLNGNIDNQYVFDSAFGNNSKEVFDNVKHIQFIACGSSYHAALVAKYWIERFAGIPCMVTIASEFRMQVPIVLSNTLLVAISQSGETADLLSALRLAKKYNYLASLAICNVTHSSLVRETDMLLHTRAGPEVGVASTKAFLTQLLALLMLTLCIARRNKNCSIKEAEIIKTIKHLPRILTECLGLEDQLKEFANHFIEKQHALFLGRGPKYPIAMEGALKLKEISYIHAEAYPAGELKHGPLALIDEKMPVIALVANDIYQEKMLSNIEEVKSRGGQVFIFAEKNRQTDYSKISKHICYLPDFEQNEENSTELIKPILYTIPMQLLAYHIAVLRGTDVDKPRNLAKSVTVE